jgi:serine/threonine protein kinase
LALTPGTRLGVYEVTAPIGAGGMGEVYRATDTKLKRQVAIKLLPPSRAASRADPRSDRPGLQQEHTIVMLQNFADELRRRVPPGK